jgi:hypothetical protein
MSDDVFGQLCFFTFVSVPTDSIANIPRNKRVKLATVHCRRSECDGYVKQFNLDNEFIARRVVAEFSFREML